MPRRPEIEAARVGSVFSIPIDKELFCYGKLLVDDGLCKAACIYNKICSDRRNFNSSNLNEIRMRYIFISGVALQEGLWPVISSEEISSGENLSNDAYIVGSPPMADLLSFSGKKIRQAKSDDFERYLCLLVRGDRMIENAVANMLKNDISENNMILRFNNRKLDDVFLKRF
jgi:hypothetical protein